MGAAASLANSVDILNRAEKLLSQSQEDQAFELYTQLQGETQIGSLAYYRMGEILNRRQDPANSFKNHRKAFEVNPHLTRCIRQADHPSYDYEYRVAEQTRVTSCPLCGGKGRQHSCYNIVTYEHFTVGFDPIRLWMHCDSCNHIFAASRPADLGAILRKSAHDSCLAPNIPRFPLLTDIVSGLKRAAFGDRFLEVGVGAGEMIAVAKEMLFDVTGIDIRPSYAEAVSNMLNVPVHAVDFIDFAPNQAYDVICMGDVIEHTIDPVAALSKAVSLLDSGGVLWISTPNFESAFSMVTKDKDPMWMVCEHLNYFCFRSLKGILERLGMDVVDYALSKQYNGCMEVTSVKR
ncbi:MAG: class I SAM-dependent methyltransferase [Armatimonadota bacterium]|nr:class I SAM-dependent methyltransferase [bacterium]